MARKRVVDLNSTQVQEESVALVRAEHERAIFERARVVSRAHDDAHTAIAIGFVEGDPNAIVAALNLTMDRLNQVVTSAEQKLAALNLGVDERIKIEGENGDTKYLRFGKVNKEWKLLVGSGWPPGKQIANWAHLSNAPRDTRANAVAALPALYKKMIDVAKEEVGSLVDKVNQGEEFLATLEGT